MCIRSNLLQLPPCKAFRIQQLQRSGPGGYIGLSTKQGGYLTQNMVRFGFVLKQPLSKATLLSMKPAEARTKFGALSVQSWFRVQGVKGLALRVWVLGWGFPKP